MTETKPADTTHNQPGIMIARKLQRIDAECLKRIQAHFPAHVQMQILISVLSERMGYKPSAEIVGASSELYLAAKDRQAAAALAECVFKHRQAAEALGVYVAANVARIHSIDVSSDRFWPPRPKGTENEN